METSEFWMLTVDFIFLRFFFLGVQSLNFNGLSSAQLTCTRTYLYTVHRVFCCDDYVRVCKCACSDYFWVLILFFVTLCWFIILFAVCVCQGYINHFKQSNKSRRMETMPFFERFYRHWLLICVFVHVNLGRCVWSSLCFECCFLFFGLNFLSSPSVFFISWLFPTHAKSMVCCTKPGFDFAQITLGAQFETPSIWFQLRCCFAFRFFRLDDCFYAFNLLSDKKLFALGVCQYFN